MGDKSKLVQTKNSDDFDEPLSKIFTQCEKWGEEQIEADVCMCEFAINEHMKGNISSVIPSERILI